MLTLEQPQLSDTLELGQFGSLWVKANQHDQYCYLVGSFENVAQALYYFAEKRVHKYPNAKIIEFIRGSRL